MEIIKRHFPVMFRFFVTFFCSLLYVVQAAIGLALSTEVCPVQMRWLKRASLSSLSSDAWGLFLQRLALKGGTFPWEEGSSAHVKEIFLFLFFFFLNLHATLQLNSQRLALFKD